MGSGATEAIVWAIFGLGVVIHLVGFWAGYRTLKLVHQEQTRAACRERIMLGVLKRRTEELTMKEAKPHLSGNAVRPCRVSIRAPFPDPVDDSWAPSRREPEDLEVDA